MTHRREVMMWHLAAAALLRQIRTGSLVVVDDSGRRWTFGHGVPTATVEMHDPGFWKALMRGSRGLADSYAAGLWDTPDLVAVIRLAARNAIVIDRVRPVHRAAVDPAAAAAGAAAAQQPPAQPA